MVAYAAVGIIQLTEDGSFGRQGLNELSVDKATYHCAKALITISYMKVNSCQNLLEKSSGSITLKDMALF